jgi:ribonuclease BN (tRNA processing enzyme)
MKLVVLGSGTSVPHPQRAAAGFWLATETGSFLLDCGGDTTRRMLAENVDWPSLDAIWISHLHLDHCGGLANLLFSMKWAPQTRERKKKLSIFGCQGLRKLLSSIGESIRSDLLEQSFEVEVIELAPTQISKPHEFELLAGLKAQTVSTPHRDESLAIRLTENSAKSLVYTSDTGFDKTLASFATNTDLLILECSFWRDKPVQKHLELAEAMRIAALASPRKLVLTHLYPEWDGVDIEAEAKKLWPGDARAAFDGLRIDV